jgi:hypothetical protein
MDAALGGQFTVASVGHVNVTTTAVATPVVPANQGVEPTDDGGSSSQILVAAICGLLTALLALGLCFKLSRRVANRRVKLLEVQPASPPEDVLHERSPHAHDQRSPKVTKL